MSISFSLECVSRICLVSIDVCASRGIYPSHGGLVIVILLRKRLGSNWRPDRSVVRVVRLR